MSTSCSFARLPSFAVLVLSGDWEKFLQGQLTCDVRPLTHHTSLGAHLTPQGKMRALFRLLPGPTPASIYLSVPKNIADYALAELKKYAVFTKGLELTLSTELCTYGLWNAPLALEAGQAEHLASITHALTHPGRSIAIGTHAALDTYCATYQERPENDWLQAEILAKTPWLFQGTTELFLPHGVQLVEQGGVSFEKGCYTGQEIVARMHYRGMTGKKTTTLATCGATLTPGEVVFADGIEVGHVVMQAAELTLVCLQTTALTQTLTTAAHEPLSLLASEIESHPE